MLLGSDLSCTVKREVKPVNLNLIAPVISGSTHPTRSTVLSRQYDCHYSMTSSVSDEAFPCCMCGISAFGIPDSIAECSRSVEAQCCFVQVIPQWSSPLVCRRTIRPQPLPKAAHHLLAIPSTSSKRPSYKPSPTTKSHDSQPQHPPTPPTPAARLRRATAFRTCFFAEHRGMRGHRWTGPRRRGRRSNLPEENRGAFGLGQAGEDATPHPQVTRTKRRSSR